MFNLRTLIVVFVTALKWAVVWGLVGAAMGAVATIVEPDTGHIPRNLVPLMIGLPSSVFGFIAGLIFAFVMTPIQVNSFLGLKGRVFLGAIVGATAGIVFMNLLAHSVVAILLAAFLGGTLAARFVRSEGLAKGNREAGGTS